MRENKKEKKYYPQSVMCENCKTREMFKIPFGTTIEDFGMGRVCKVCGCQIRIPLIRHKK